MNRMQREKKDVDCVIFRMLNMRMDVQFKGYCMATLFQRYTAVNPIRDLS